MQPALSYGGSITTVPYVYRKNVAVQTYGSVIATYKG